MTCDYCEEPAVGILLIKDADARTKGMTSLCPSCMKRACKTVGMDYPFGEDESVPDIFEGIADE